MAKIYKTEEAANVAKAAANTMKHTKCLVTFHAASLTYAEVCKQHPWVRMATSR